jgi:carboxypeptidase PM20D1
VSAVKLPMLKKIALTFVALVAVLAVVLVVRTLSTSSLQPAGAEDVSLVVDEVGALERFQAAIRIPTISHENVEDTDSAAFRALHAHFEQAYPLVHANLTRELVGGRSLLFTWEGSEPDLEPVVLMGHQDVVPVIPGTEADWAYPPYGAVVADGFVWGRGTMDDKISVVAILEAVEALLADGFRPRRTHYLAFGHDEEVGGVRGAAAIADLLESRGAEPYAYVVDEGGAVVRDLIPGIEGAVAIIGVAEKGYVNLELVVEGAGGHSSTPPPSTNIGILSAAIAELEDHQFPARFDSPAKDMFTYLGPEMAFLPRMVFANLWLFGPVVRWGLLSDPSTASMVRTTTAVTIVEGGVKANVLPIRARAVVNHRILPGETIESVRARVREVIDDERVQVRVLGEEGTNPSPVSDPSGAPFALLARTIQQVVPGEDLVVAPYLVMGGTDAKFYSGRSSDVFRFLPAPVGPDALQRAHGTNERMSLDGLFASIRFFQQLIRNSDEL